MEKEALGRSRDFEQAHAMPSTIRRSIAETNEEMSHMLEDATQNLGLAHAEVTPEHSSTDMLKGGCAETG